jgi:hypothetical protein
VVRLAGPLPSSITGLLGGELGIAGALLGGGRGVQVCRRIQYRHYAGDARPVREQHHGNAVAGGRRSTTRWGFNSLATKRFFDIRIARAVDFIRITPVALSALAGDPFTVGVAGWRGRCRLFRPGFFERCLCHVALLLNQPRLLAQGKPRIQLNIEKVLSLSPQQALVLGNNRDVYRAADGFRVLGDLLL